MATVQDRSGEERAVEPLATRGIRPVLAAMIESQPMPVFVLSASGSLASNALAKRFATRTPHGSTVLAHDGTDLWTIIVGRVDEADPFFDLHLRLRDNAGQAVETTLSVIPVRGTGGALASAVIFVLAMPGERVSPARPTAPDELHSVVERVSVLTGADHVSVIEYDQDAPREARIRAHHAADGREPEAGSIGIGGTPLGAFGGRKVLVIPERLTELFPEDGRIKPFAAYAGVILTNAKGETIGCLSAMWKEPLKDVPGMMAVLCIQAIPAARALAFAIARTELKESEQRYGAVFEGSGVPILLVEPVSTQIVDANPSACEFYGYTRDDLVTMSILQFDSQQTAEGMQSEIERAMKSTRDRFMAQQMLSGGRVRDVEISIGPIRVNGRKLLYCMVNDITERKRMEAQLERSKRSLESVVGQRTQDLLRANTELQQASMSRDLMLGGLAQELRTSVQTINGFSELLLEGMAGELTPEQRRQVEMVRQAGSRLSTFANGLVETHRDTEADSLPATDEFNLVDLVQSVVLGLASFAEDKGLSLEFETHSSSLVIASDRYKVQQVLLNLLSNAIRYTERGGVTASVSGCVDGQVSVTVRDTGVGISTERLASIFDGPEITPGKAGIGLPASKHIAASLGGAIDAKSTPGTGSVFSLRLPCGASDAELEDDHE